MTFASGLTSSGGSLTVHTSYQGELILTGINTFNGPITINDASGIDQGNLQLSGANGAMTGANAYNIFRNGALVLDNTNASGGNNNIRMSYLRRRAHGGDFYYYGADADSTNSSETVGAISGSGNSLVTITTPDNGANTATLTAASLTHAAGNGSIQVVGNFLVRMRPASIRFILTAAPTLVETMRPLRPASILVSPIRCLFPFSWAQPLPTAAVLDGKVTPTLFSPTIMAPDSVR